MMLKCNPLLSTAEYDSLPRSNNGKTSKRKRNKSKGKGQFVQNSNPFLDFPEYETKSRTNIVNDTESKRLETDHEGGSVAGTEKKRRKRKDKSINNSSLILVEKKPLMNGRSVSRRREDRMNEKPTWGIPKQLNKNESRMMDAKVFQAADPLSLEAVGGFDWNATPRDLTRVVTNTADDKSESEDSEEEVSIKRRKLTPAEKRAKAVEEEKTMKKKEKELLVAEENPQSPDHFERLLIGSPDSAELWIKYMGYHAVNADIERARAVARRAIKRIDPQITAAKLDVWIAFLNLEFTFSPPELFKETFSEALKCNDDYAINSRVLNLYVESKNVTEVDQLTNIMVKKYKNKVQNWLQCQNALMSVGLHEKARNLLEKALNVLTKKEHVTLISRFALLENKHGFPEQAQALFENLMTSFPQRLDLLSVYVDMLIKSQSIELARSVLERAASNKLPFRKMKSIYMKWLAFEEAHGAPSDLAKVEQVAKKYVSDALRPRPINKVEIASSGNGNDAIKKESDESELDDETGVKQEVDESSAGEDPMSNDESD